MIRLRNSRRLCAVALVSMVLLNAAPALSCGPFFPQAVFTYKLHPDLPLEDFARGQLGILLPSHARSYLFVAYRYLSGSPFDAVDQKALVAMWQQRLRGGSGDVPNMGVKEWLSVRAAIMSPEKGARIEVHRFTANYAWYVNCLDDAFRVAAQTLHARSASFGVTSPELKEWLAGQDQVFRNCASGATIPAPLASSAPSLLQADRTYQIAAAHFYANHLDTAESLFRKIAADATNPWRSTAAYMVTRTLIRIANLNDNVAPAIVTRWQQAEQEIQRLMADKQFTAVHAAAAKLHGYVEYRLHPQRRLAELAKSLRQSGHTDTLQQDLSDYTWLMDRQEQRGNLDDLTDWIFTFQANDPTAMSHALDKWRETKARHWLVAAIAKLDVGRTESAEILHRAAAVQPGDPAYVSVLYHRARLLAELGKKAEARQLLDQLLANSQPQLPQSALNLFMQKRLELAQSLDEFIKFAPRRPATITTSDDNTEINNEKSPYGGKDYFDNDGASSLSRALPVSVLQNVARNSKLPEHLRRDLILATWTRAILLDDQKIALALQPELDRLVPELRADLVGYSAVRAPLARQFAATYMMLRNPGLRPYISAGVGRITQVSRIDDYQDNWWCDLNATIAKDVRLDTPSLYSAMRTSTKTKPAAPKLAALSFLNEQQRTDASREIVKLAEVPAAPNYFGQRVVDWAKQNPNDPRVPEALHLTVKASRFACGDENTGKFSKAAFDLLHRRYPQSPWTKKTTYWYS